MSLDIGGGRRILLTWDEMKAQRLGGGFASGGGAQHRGTRSQPAVYPMVIGEHRCCTTE
jgi:hypothetical protein